MVFLHDLEDIREAFSKAEINGRYFFDPFMDQNRGHENAGNPNVSLCSTYYNIECEIKKVRTALVRIIRND